MKAVHTFAAIAVAASIALAGPALAHPKLLSATPADKATASNVTEAKLVFSETLVAPVSGVDLSMAAMPGMAAMKIGGVKTALGADGKTLVATFPKLAAGKYQLDWHAVSTDTHRVAGSYSFTVK